MDKYPENEVKLAVFFNSVKPYSPSQDIGSDATKQFQRDLRRHSHFLKGRSTERRKSSVSQEEIGALVERRQSIVSQRRESIIAWKNNGIPRRRSSAASISDDESEEEQSQVWKSLFSPVFCFDPDSFPCKIQIPTLHVIGTNDPFQDYSKELITLCDPEQLEVVVSDSGHEIPRSDKGLESVIEAFEMIVMMASVSGS